MYTIYTVIIYTECCTKRTRSPMLTSAHTGQINNPTACTCVFASGQQNTRERGIDVYGLKGEKHCSAFQSRGLRSTR